MYLLTKNLYLNFILREKIFYELLKENYSDEIIKKYKPMILGIKFSKQKEKYNLGVSLKNLLISVQLKSYLMGYKIIATISGTGFFKLNLERMEYFIVSSLLTSAENSIDKTVYIDIKIYKSKIKIKIKYKGKMPFKFHKYFKVRKIFGTVNLIFKSKLEKCNFGKEKNISDFTNDRISTINLAFID